MTYSNCTIDWLGTHNNLLTTLLNHVNPTNITKDLRLLNHANYANIETTWHFYVDVQLFFLLPLIDFGSDMKKTYPNAKKKKQTLQTTCTYLCNHAKIRNPTNNMWTNPSKDSKIKKPRKQCEKTLVITQKKDPRNNRWTNTSNNTMKKTLQKMWIDLGNHLKRKDPTKFWQ